MTSKRSGAIVRGLFLTASLVGSSAVQVQEVVCCQLVGATGTVALQGAEQAQEVVCCQGRVSETAITLFDGHSLEGWGRRDGSVHPGWDIDDGALHRKSGGGDLYFRDPLGDFDLYFKWRIASGGNSGLKYRVRDFDGSWLGCEYQLLDDSQHGDANKTAGLYDVFDPPDHKPVVKPNVWNHSRIVVCGNHIEHWLNGIQTVSVTVGSSSWKSAVAASKFANNPGFGENRIGRLFLQDHGDEVWFRDIVLVPLKCPVCTGYSAFEPAILCCENPRSRVFRRKAVDRSCVSLLPFTTRKWARCRMSR